MQNEKLYKEAVEAVVKEIKSLPILSVDTIGRALIRVNENGKYDGIDSMELVYDVREKLEEEGFYMDDHKYDNMIVGTPDNFEFVLRKLNSEKELTKEDFLNLEYIRYDEVAYLYNPNKQHMSVEAIGDAYIGRYGYENEFKISREDGQKFLEKLWDLGMISWEENYEPDGIVMDGIDWTFLIALKDGRIYRKQGYFVFPDGFDEVTDEFTEVLCIPKEDPWDADDEKA